MDARSITFGPYVLTRSGDLRKHDVPLKLQRKPLEVLRALLEQPGETVTRQELHARLWPGNTFVDFDQGLNVAIKKLRDALCDSADNPRYIQTVQGVGYRFLCPVTVGPLQITTPGPASSENFDAALVETSAGTANAVPLPAVPDTPGRSPYLGWWRIAASVAAIAVLGVGSWLALARYAGAAKISHAEIATKRQPQRLVVLPFQNLTGDSVQEYFCDGLADELTAMLGTLSPRKLQVIARTSAEHYKQSSLTAAQIGSELKADYIVSGSVRRLGSLYRITVELTDAQAQANIWTGAFDRDFKDVLDVYRDVAMVMSREIDDRISPPNQHPAFGAQPVNPLAHDAYLRGRFHWNKRTVTDLRDSLDEFQRALAIDPDYPEAHAGLADSYSLLASYGAIPFRDGYPKARAEAQRALQIDPHSAEAKASLALIEAYYDWNFEQAEQDFRDALSKNPNYATAHHWYGMFLSQHGRSQEAIGELKQAEQLDPLSLTIGIDLSNAYIYASRYDEAERQLLKVRALDPTYYGTYGAMSWLYVLQGRLPEAERENETLKKLSGNDSGNDFILAYGYAKAGQTRRARDLLLSLSKLTRKRGDHSQCPMDAYLALGDDTAALQCLDEAIREHADWLVPLIQDAEFRKVASDPRFESRLRRAGYPLRDVANGNGQ